MYSRKSPPCIDKKDKRYPKYKEQFKETGVWPDETWNLDYCIAQFLAPRLDLMAQTMHSFPPELTFKQWKKILIDTAKSCRLYVKDEDVNNSWEERIKIQDFLGKYFSHLWD